MKMVATPGTRWLKDAISNKPATKPSDEPSGTAGLERARQAVCDGRLGQAVCDIDEVRRADPKLETRTYKAGTAAYGSADYAEAEFCFFVCVVCRRNNTVYLDALRCSVTDTGHALGPYIAAGFDVSKVHSCQAIGRSALGRFVDAGIDTAATLAPGWRSIRTLCYGRVLASAEPYRTARKACAFRRGMDSATARERRSYGGFLILDVTLDDF